MNHRVQQLEPKPFTRFTFEGQILHNANKIIFVGSQKKEFAAHRRQYQSYLKANKVPLGSKRKESDSMPFEEGLNSGKEAVFGFKWLPNSKEDSKENRIKRSCFLNNLCNKLSGNVLYVDESFFMANCDISEEDAPKVLDKKVVDARRWNGRYDGFFCLKANNEKNEKKDNNSNSNSNKKTETRIDDELADGLFYQAYCKQGHKLWYTNEVFDTECDNCDGECKDCFYTCGTCNKDAYICESCYNEMAHKFMEYQSYQSKIGAVLCSDGNILEKCEASFGICSSCGVKGRFKTQLIYECKCSEKESICMGCYNSLFS